MFIDNNGSFPKERLLNSEVTPSIKFTKQFSNFVI